MAWSSEGIRLTLFLVLGLLTRAVGEVLNSRHGDQDAGRWEVSKPGQCSVACGGGIQVRTVRCVRSSQIFGSDKEILCPLPEPPMTLSCNNHACTAHWNTSDWSQCSATCGLGTQRRDVTCQRFPLQGPRYLVAVAHAECGGLAPESTRKCYDTDCKDTPHVILSENYTLIQLHKAKHIRVNVGGQIYILPGQNIVVSCRVTNFRKSLIHWSKDYSLVHLMGRKSGKSSGLRINDANPREDAGVYTCNAGNATATITVNFIEKDDPSAKMYKKWMKNSHKNNQKYTTHQQETNNVISAAELNLEESNQQRDQSHNSSHSSLNYVTDDWSPCSATCKAKGHRKRKVSCSHMTPKYVKILPDSECQVTGLEKPEALEECSIRKPCATWRPGPWSKCLPNCGSSGNRTRLLTCVWESTGRPAGANCDRTNKLKVSKPCKPGLCPLGVVYTFHNLPDIPSRRFEISCRRIGITPPCVDFDECKDSSRYCSLAPLLKLCRFYHFKQQCCHTCHRLSNSTH